MSIASTLLTDIRAKYPDGLDKQAHRLATRGLTQALISQTNDISSIFTDAVKEDIKTRMGRVVGIPVIKKKDIVLKNVRSCTITPFENDTALVNVTTKTLVADITMVKAQYQNNSIDYQNDFEVKIKAVVRAFYDEIEADTFALLNTNKSTIYNSTLVTGAPYSIVADTIEVPSTGTLQDLFFNDMDAIQGADEFNERMDVIGDINLMPFIRHYTQQGAANDENLSYQFGNYDFKFSNAVTGVAGKRATGFVVPKGTMGIVTTTDFDSKANAKTTSGVSWSVESLPNFPFPVGIMYKSDCSDQSGLAIGTELDATKFEQFQISLDVTMAVAYNQDPVTLAGGIKKFTYLV